MKLKSFASGDWFEFGDGGNSLPDAVTGETIAEISSEGLDFAGMADYARTTGKANLRKYTFPQRAAMLTELAKFLGEHKDEFYALSTSTGATKRDSWFDIDGGIGVLFVYGSKGRKEMPDANVYIDGNPEFLGKGGTFVGQHIYVPLDGVAVHINAFNFPCWGMLEKLAPCLLAGVPAIVKPASSTAYLTEAVFKKMIESKILPEGSIQLISGSTGDLLSHLTSQDFVAFTGSKTTADLLRQHPNIIDKATRFSAEADSVNCSILGNDAEPGSPEFDLYIKEIVNEMTTKAGQKCTAIRRIIAPERVSDAVVAALGEKLAKIRVGHPGVKETRMGALANLAQREEVRSRVAELCTDSEIVYGDLEDFEVHDADRDKGAFLAPILLRATDTSASGSAHNTEAFGPVSTVLGYSDTADAVRLANLGGGSLVGSIFSYDKDITRELALGIAPWHGRLLLANRDCAEESTGHGPALPQLVHGGPGRAGGGEEMGGIRGVLHYMQRTALQGSPANVSYSASGDEGMIQVPINE
jgi:oxepin-CoA hydrolase/3-oxo-5,6-dehydrosuberyl-CoA semialdehyde dehydrogenase